ncbi:MULTISPECIES: hypothetical protein [Vibrio]|uniref:Uncharacterized protein n=1 Tax=Vibrio tasmaniensis TaxID=212663 RepID=A0A2N7NN70_9VIBR|nr:hypothetical protein [Vibrio tasmaniensis]PMO89885.1 hypothetical protein BCT01_00970 [Vibrio tasmaniensis]PMP17751.1 hypothetical protein BCS92_04925 [Vibrio tasmaniensis]TKG27990.1 hypothetical protein FC057_22645 [Vibrio tasmaniensis]TKG41645.1 hypothetical protein FC063_07225 [Vibrio tasmaniensis]TKG44889.1 hypothetical protein FC061_20360 [Vibrio tasmaniensis]
MTNPKTTSIEFNVDIQLSGIAEELTKFGLNYCGGTFNHQPTNEEFEITLSKVSWVHDLKKNADDMDRKLKESKVTINKLEKVLETLVKSNCINNEGIAIIDTLKTIKP